MIQFLFGNKRLKFSLISFFIAPIFSSSSWSSAGSGGGGMGISVNSVSGMGPFHSNPENQEKAFLLNS